MLNKNIVRHNGVLGKIHRVLRDGEEAYIFQPYFKRRYDSNEDDVYQLSDFEPTDAQEQLEYIKKTFSSGPVIGAANISDFQIVHYLDYDNEECFAIYVDFVDAHVSTHSLDYALIEALAIKYDGCNSQAGVMFSRMLRMDKNK